MEGITGDDRKINILVSDIPNFLEFFLLSAILLIWRVRFRHILFVEHEFICTFFNFSLTIFFFSSQCFSYFAVFYIANNLQYSSDRSNRFVIDLWKQCTVSVMCYVLCLEKVDVYCVISSLHLCFFSGQNLCFFFLLSTIN